ncbi:MAG: thioredoxin family protein [Euryarchaeota archaeon]|nr:thioredoxin family protein [Euryarchaeota archaeon]
MVTIAQRYKLKIGSAAPPFVLPCVDGKTHALPDFKGEALLVVFSCNHCPYVQSYEERLIAIGRDYVARGLDFVAVNSNEIENYPEDDFAHMVERAKAKGYTFHYVRDESQEVAESFGAQCTPHVFLFDHNRRLAYQGRIDDNRDATQVKRHELREAIEALFAGRPVGLEETPAFGCSIKWDKEPKFL